MTEITIEPIEYNMTIEELRREFRIYVDEYYALLYAIRDIPEIPSPSVLISLSIASKWPEDNSKGKELQRQYKLDKIPYKTECECGAGVWFRILNGLKNP